MSTVKNLLVLVIGGILGAAALFFFAPTSLINMDNHQGNSENPAEEKSQPLYWVAPMDANYRRDAPGKSPMGMDLVPVYAKEKGNKEEGQGTIEISPEIVNNLGVRTAIAEYKSLKPEVKTVGYLQYNQDSIVHIHPRVDGWVEQSYINSVGDPVTQGQKLYTLYSPALVNAQEELIFGLKRNDQRMVQAAEERLRALQISSRFIRQLKKTRKVSQTVTFYAPVSGVIDNLNVREGLYVQPGITLMTIVNLDEIWLEAEVFERQASLVKAGLPVEVALNFMPGETRQGVVDYVYPSLDATTRTLRLRVRLENSNHALKPNMFAQLRIITDDDKKRIIIPTEAVIQSSQQDRVVLALGEGKFKSINVTTGRKDKDYVEILTGLAEGEKVVTSAQFLLDSESSKSSDFTRIDAQIPEKKSKPQKVWVKATINSVDAAAQKLNAQHDAIPEWNWPQMVMDFKLGTWVRAEDLPINQALHLEVSKIQEGGYEVTDFFVSEDRN